MTAVCEQCEEREPMLGGVTCLPCWRLWWRDAAQQTISNVVDAPVEKQRRTLSKHKCSKCSQPGHNAATCGREAMPRDSATETEEQLDEVARRLRLFDSASAIRHRPMHGAFGIVLPSTEPELVGVAGVLPAIRSSFRF